MKKRPGKTRQINIAFRISDEESDAFTAAADALGITLSSWARMKLREAVGLTNPGRNRP